MPLLRGKLLANNIDELNDLEIDPKDGVKRVINLKNINKYEYEGDIIPALRMMMELYRDEYQFYHLNIFNANNEQMIMYANFKDKSNESKNVKKANKIASKYVDKNYSLYEHIKHPNESTTNFWWDIEYNCLIFFGNEKIDVINYFLDSCFTRDGGKEEVAKQLVKAGYKI